MYINIKPCQGVGSGNGLVDNGVRDRLKAMPVFFGFVSHKETHLCGFLTDVIGNNVTATLR